MTLLVPLIISEPGLEVEEIIPMCENKGAGLRFMAHGGELVHLVFLVYLVCRVCLVRRTRETRQTRAPDRLSWPRRPQDHLSFPATGND